jgi:hypothetical protein
MANTETLWQELTVAAVLGTQRRAFTAPETGGNLGSALRAAGLEAEKQILRMASAAALHRRAGRLPARGSATLPAPCPPETWSRCSRLAGSFLEAILSGDTLPMLPEWVALAAQSQQRIREEHLALILQQSRAIQPIRAILLPVLGERGRWLARLNPDWHGYDTYSGETIWHEGKRKERAAFLGDLRGRDPARARELLASTWGQESPGERVTLLAILASGLSLADEDFLENVLAEDGKSARHKAVRQTAAGLLARLPGSRLVQRMSARAGRALTWKNGLLRSSLEVNTPDSCDENMQRDGVEPQPPPGVQMGEKAWWLMQMLSAVPPAAWSAQWNRKPAQILAVIRKHEWEEALYQGWQAAAAAFQDSEWLEALLFSDLQRTNKPVNTDLFAQLPTESRGKLMVSLLQEHPSLAYDQPASLYLAACHFPWNEDLTRAFTLTVCAHLYKGDLPAWRWERLLRESAPYFHPDLLSESIERLSTALKRKADGDTAVDKLLMILQFRLEMRQAFTKESL